MPDNNTNTMVDFGTPEKENTIIKAIGVGGGGGNAVNHMYKQGIHDVSFVLCNTDNQALSDSSVPVLLQLGEEGLGAGNKPAKARKAAEDSIDAIKEMLNDGTKMAFITAGMGGGTGTGAAPVIARVSKEMGILTVGIVTIPFRFEGKRKIDQALDGVEEMAKNVDALLVINNERLRKIYPDLTVLSAFEKADDTLSVAAKSIAEIITNHGLINLDFNDVKTVLKDGGVAIMSTGYGEGEGRVKQAIEDALNSPLLNDNDVFNAKKILLSINFAKQSNNGEAQNEGGLMMEEMNEVNDFMEQFGSDFEIKWGIAFDPELGKKVKVTILATGFGIKNEPDFEVYLTIDRPQDGWDGHVGFVPAYVKELGLDPTMTAVLCGPPIMIKFTLAGLLELGFSKERVYTTLELRMKCGIGKCGRCNVGDKFVCKDGPVFRMDELDELPNEY